MNLQRQAKKFANQKGEILLSPSVPRMFEILQGRTLARVWFLEKENRGVSRKDDASL
jgi:hypothetical protein